MTVKEMAIAHLRTVEQSIKELENQKSLIDQEIVKLNEYIKAGQELLDNESND